jgi:hypothetical protein
MKIKKFNESVEEYFDMEFIHECFIDFEESNFDVKFEIAPNSSWGRSASIDIEFNLPDNMVNSEGSIPDSLDKLELKTDFYENLRVSLVKVGSKYNNYNYYITDEESISSNIILTIYSNDESLTHKISSLM